MQETKFSAKYPCESYNSPNITYKVPARTAGGDKM